MFDRISSFFARQAQKRALAQELYGLDERELSDLGMSRADIPAILEQSLSAQPSAAARTQAFGAERRFA